MTRPQDRSECGARRHPAGGMPGRPKSAWEGEQLAVRVQYRKGLPGHYHEALGIQSLGESWPVPCHIHEEASTISHAMHRRDLAPGKRHAFLIHAVAGDEIVSERDGIACLDTWGYGGWAQHIGGNIARPL